MDADFTELMALAADLDVAPARASRNVRKALQYTATNLKRDWRQGAARSGLEGYAASVDYDIETSPDGVDAVVGPNLARNQGSFGFVEDGGSSVFSAPQHAGRDALEANENDFYRGLLIAITDAVED